MSLEGGQVFAGYTIVRVLGTGGMGSVYLASHPRLPRQDALKVLPADLTADPEFRARFLREAELAAGLSHPNIVGIHDRGEEDGQFWISMDYVAGTDAGRFLRDHFPGRDAPRGGGPDHRRSGLGAGLCASSRVVAPRCQAGQHSVGRPRWARAAGVFG